jgi:NAD(P)-dependent dehydrogenase (short-subunit alcohol dehydrogenase family)
MTARLGIEGRSALVTGGTSQAGSACVQRLRQEGMTVAFTAGDRERGGSLAAETGAMYLECDPKDRAGCDRALAEALAAADGRLDVLVTCVAPRIDGSLQETSEAVLHKLLEANLTGAFRAGRACLETMRAQGSGSMIHVASAAGIRADHEAGAYSVACAGVIALAELLASEAAPYGVRSNAVCAGDEDTDVAPTVVWLACDESAHVNGATLRVDDGAGATMLVDTRA